MILKSTYSKDDIHDAWESVYRGNPLQDSFNDTMLDEMERWLDLSAGARVLDAGCGVGYHAVRIAHKGYRCVGVDISRSMLARAYRNAAASPTPLPVAFSCGALERLAFRDGAFDAVHCRGVLMHVPDWARALAELCRVLRPGGRIAIMESNHHSVEATLVRIVRQLRRSQSTMTKTPGGFELWSDENGVPFVVRIADTNRLMAELERCGVRVVRRYASEFWDINRFRAGLIRNLVIRYNRLWFGLGLPALFSAGNVVIGEKIVVADRPAQRRMVRLERVEDRGGLMLGQ